MAWPQEYRSETYCLMKLTARPWCLDFTVHSFHDLFDRPFFLPFCITRIRRLRSFIHDRYPRKLFTKDETKEEKIGRSCLEIYILKEKKCFSKDGDSKVSMIRIVRGSRRKEWKTSSLMSFILLFHEEDVQPTRE